VLVGIATGSTASVLAAVVSNRWFVSQRGLVTGLLTASNATGQLVFLPALAALAVGPGWRASALTVAGAAVVVAIVVAILMRDRPRDIGLRPFGSPPNAEEAPSSTANPFTAAIGGLLRGVKTPNFWFLAGSFFICGATTNGLIGTHLIPASMEHGIPEVTAAGMLAVIGIFDLIGTTVSGWLSDRFDNRWLLAWYYTLRGLALLLLPYALGSTFLSLAVFVVFYGLDWVATVPPTVRLTADTFGKQNVGIVYGWIFASHQLGAATAAFGGGLLHNWLGDYQITFISAGLLALIAAGLVTRINRRAPAQVAPAQPLEAAAS
jgi:sugar phosphate permease